MKRWLLFFIGLSVVLMGCDNKKPPTPEPATLNLTQTAYEVMVGEEVELLFTSSKETVAITSKDDTIATVSNGKVKGVKVGTVKIEFKVDSIVEEATITVKTTISITDEMLSFREDESYQLEVAILGGSAIYTSSDNAIATVSETGFITGIKPGSVTITISVLEDESIHKEISVTIESIPIVETNLLKAKENTEALKNFTLSIKITETKQFVDQEETLEFGYHFNDAKFMFTGANDPIYYSIENSKTYEFKRSLEGYAKEETDFVVSEFRPFYIGLEFEQFEYLNGAYLLKYGEEKHFDNFLTGLSNPKISGVRLTLENDFYKHISFVVTTKEGAFKYEFEFQKINQTVVTLPKV